MTLPKTSILLSLLAWLLIAVSCDHSVVTKLTPNNYDQITTGMTKAQVERILGPPTTVETKDMMIFKKTTYRYEDGKKFAMFTFKNDELDSKEGNLQREPWWSTSRRVHLCCFERKNERLRNAMPGGRGSAKEWLSCIFCFSLSASVGLLDSLIGGNESQLEGMGPQLSQP